MKEIIKIKNVLYNKPVGITMESVFGIVSDALDELKEKGIIVSRPYPNEFSAFFGIHLYPVNDQFSFFAGIWFSYYASTGIPLCFGFEDQKEKLNRQLQQDIKNLMIKEPSLHEYRFLDNCIVCGVKAEKVNELIKHGGLADYLLQLVNKTGNSLQLK